MVHRTKRKLERLESFDFKPGRILARKYEVVSSLGGGWEGEVYKVKEVPTGIELAAKFFFPHRNPRDRSVLFYAKKLHKLRHCPIVIQYHTQETIVYKGWPVTFLVSDFVDGELLSQFLARQPAKRITPFQSLHMLHALASGIECIHKLGEYHGDLHTDNIIISRYGLGFEFKLVDMFHWQAPRAENLQDDVCNMIRIFYDALGGAKQYARQPQEVKDICLGLKRTLIRKKFRNASQLKDYLETMQWR